MDINISPMPRLIPLLAVELGSVVFIDSVVMGVVADRSVLEGIEAKRIFLSQLLT